MQIEKIKFFNQFLAFFVSRFFFQNTDFPVSLPFYISETVDYLCLLYQSSLNCQNDTYGMFIFSKHFKSATDFLFFAGNNLYEFFGTYTFLKSYLRYLSTFGIEW